MTALNEGMLQGSKSMSELPYLPGNGFPKPLRTLWKHSALDDDGQFGYAREVHFEWAELEEDEYFEVDLANEIVYLNKRWRSATNANKRGSSTDALIPKALLFHSLRDLLGRLRWSKTWQAKVREMNRMLVDVARHTEGRP